MIVSTSHSLLATERFLTVLPGSVLGRVPKSPTLKALSVRLPRPRLPIAIVTLKNRTLSPIGQLLIGRVRDLAKRSVRSFWRARPTPAQCRRFASDAEVANVPARIAESFTPSRLVRRCGEPLRSGLSVISLAAPAQS